MTNFEDKRLKKWFHIKARYMGIFKPNGKVITFWLRGSDDEQITKMVLNKNYKDIEWIAEKDPSFI